MVRWVAYGWVCMHEGQVVGDTDLRDGEWHHVAVVLYGGSLPNVGTHVMLYLDGDPEPVSRRSLREVKTKIEGSSGQEGDQNVRERWICGRIVPVSLNLVAEG